MSGVTTATAVTLAATVVSTGLATYGAIAQGQQQQAQAKYQAAVARNNQIIANQNAQDALDRGDEAVRQQRLKTQLLIGQQRAALAAQGGDINSGSALDLQMDTAGAGALDALTIKNNAQREARQYQIQGTNFAADATLDDAKGANAMAGSWLEAGSSLLGGAASFGDKWNKYVKPAPAPTLTTNSFLSGGGPRGF